MLSFTIILVTSVCGLFGAPAFTIVPAAVALSSLSYAKHISLFSRAGDLGMQNEIDQTLVEKGVQVIDMMTFDFKWSQYSEEYTKQVKEIIEKKALGEEIVLPEVKLPEIVSIETELDKMLAIDDESVK